MTVTSRGCWFEQAGVGEEAPGAYKDSTAVVEAAHAAGRSRKIATLLPIICING